MAGESALALSAPSLSVNESGTLQLSANLLFGDDTATPLDANTIVWSVASGPLSGIDAAGLITTETVYQNSAAAVQGIYQSFTGSLDLTVLDTDPDNFGSYAGDSLEDAWQVFFFGEENPDAAPLLDPDGDGQNNAFEFTAGLVPTHALSYFSFSVGPVPNQPGQTQIVFDPIVTGRNYTVMTSLDLSQGSWNPLSGSATSDRGTERTVTDPAVSGTGKFYKVKIEKP